MNIHWLDQKPSQSTGISWGVPWPEGTLHREEKLAFTSDTKKHLPLQSWPIAFWPDGSVKWTGHATVLGPDAGEDFTLEKAAAEHPEQGMQVTETEAAIFVYTGSLQCRLPKQGKVLLDQMQQKGAAAVTKGTLSSLIESRTVEEFRTAVNITAYDGLVQSAEVEQRGPVRTVVKVEGIHVAEGKQLTLPFVLRLYFYAGTASIRMVHTLFYDGNPDIHFIKGAGISFQLPLAGEPWNRFVHFAGEEGMYTEPAQLLHTRRNKHAGGLYPAQIAGKPAAEVLDAAMAADVKQNAVWNSFKLVQDSDIHYKISKRTAPNLAWVPVLRGTQAGGLVYAGGETGGVAAGIKDFRWKHPASLEVDGLAEDQSRMTVWFWSPDSEAMDLRHYSSRTHVESAYEGFPEMRATPYGIANTSEAYLHCFASPPSKETLSSLAADWQDPPLLRCAPETYYQSGAAGLWSLPDTTDPSKAFLEDQLSAALHFYQREVKQRGWTGYWNYGDFMHTYDPVRHQWLYDMGGFAWQNTELVPNLWLWYAFFRTGAKDTFRMAEAMTRHTSEVDQYHFGEYAGLGSRHNVSHWGCGCKEARISMAGLHKYYYFLTTDERTRDLLIGVKDAEQALLTLDPMREFFPKDEFPTHARSGPDWSAFCSNWFSEWERTEDTSYLKKIQTGMQDIKQQELGLLAAPTFGFDPATSHLYPMEKGQHGAYHMIIAFGAPQVWMEIAHVLKDQQWEDLLAEFGAFYLLSDEEKRKKSSGLLNDNFFHWPVFATGLAAFAANRRHDPALAAKTWDILLNADRSHIPLPIRTETVSAWDTIEEIPWVTTNTVAQWCLNTMQALELIGDQIPADAIEDLQKEVHDDS